MLKPRPDEGCVCASFERGGTGSRDNHVTYGVTEPLWVAPLETRQSRDGSECSLSSEAELSCVHLRAH
eukprot:1766008-Rhodomonas_salina.1